MISDERYGFKASTMAQASLKLTFRLDDTTSAKVRFLHVAFILKAFDDFETRAAELVDKNVMYDKMKKLR